MKTVKDLKVNDVIYIVDNYSEEIRERIIVSTYEEKEYRYFITNHKELCSGEINSSTIYSEKLSNLFINKSEAIDKIISRYEIAINSGRRCLEDIKNKYLNEKESYEIYITKKEEELKELKKLKNES